MNVMRTPRVRSRVAAALLAGVAVAAAVPSPAQEVWIGRPTIGDVMRHHLAEAIRHQQQAVRSKAQFGAQIAEGRAAFFATAKKPESRAEAGKRFAELLYAKDLVYMSGLLATGTGPESQKRAAMTHMITGGDIDGGIPPVARKAFDAWVDDVRGFLGARGRDTFLLLTDPARLREALDASAASYERYRELRDRFEIDRYTTARSVGKARLAPGVFRLHEQQKVALDLYRDTRIDLLGRTRPLRSKLGEMAKGGQMVLRCAYGPKDGYADGTPQYEHVLFWFARAPDGIEELLAADAAHGMAGLHTRAARDICPENSAVAKATWKGGETAGRAEAAKTPQQREDEQRAAMEAAGVARRAESAARRAAEAERMEAERAGAEHARQAQLAALDARKETQRLDHEQRQQARRDASAQSRCAAWQARLEKARQQWAAMAPAQAERYRSRLEQLENTQAQHCSE